MRTTLNLDDDIVPVVKSLAETRSISYGAAVSLLIRQALKPDATAWTQQQDDLPVFMVSESAPPLTLADVKRGEDEA